MKKTYYVTTPLYYVNDVPHIGHAYTTVAADVLARWKRLRGEDVFFLTGTDEHGAKIAQAAQAAGVEPQAWTDRVAAEFRRLWERLNVSHDDFIRTTEPRHTRTVQAVFDRLLRQGDIYKGFYEDWYCTPCETFWSESELTEGKCPTCGRAVEKLKEESYFFKLSKYQAPLLDYFEKNPGFLLPPSRASEIKNFAKSGLTDLSVSRTKVKWGVPLPSDPGHTVYVWFDALLNYISAAGYEGTMGEGAESGPHPRSPAPAFAKTWPADVHLVGKEIFRFHTVIWPAMLMALGLPLPRRVFAHGWWTVEGEKMSKSKGNVVDPHQVAEEFGVDALRYFLLREVPFGGDGDFSRKSLLGRYNSELANALGNLLNRTLNLLEKNHAGRIPALPPDPALKFDPAALAASLDRDMEALAFHAALQSVLGLVDACNKYMDSEAPWKTIKTDPDKAARALRTVAGALKFAAAALHPIMPSITEEMWRQLGEPEPIARGGGRILRDGAVTFAEGQAVQKGAPLFPRKDAEAKNPT
jgi:methionyl-tRNA synthetase